MNKIVIFSFMFLLLVIIILLTGIFLYSVSNEYSYSVSNKSKLVSSMSDLEKMELEKELILLKQNISQEQDTNKLCKAYENLDKVKIEMKNNKFYYFINNRWILEEDLWQSCLN